MPNRSMIGRALDGLLLGTFLFVASAAFFASATRNLLYGAAFAAPVTVLFLYAWRLWRRRKTGDETLSRAARYHLQNLTLLSRGKAFAFLLTTAEELGVANAEPKRDRLTGVCQGENADVFLLQKPSDARANSSDVLRCYHKCARPRCVIVSTAAFDEQARIFAKLRNDPQITLIGPDDLLPVLRKIPAGDEPKRDEREKRRVLFSQIKRRALEPRRRNRCLFYGCAMLVAYIVFGAQTFLFPGLALVFLAVVSRGRKSL